MKKVKVAAWLAAGILALSDSELDKRLEEWRASRTNEVMALKAAGSKKSARAKK